MTCCTSDIKMDLNGGKGRGKLVVKEEAPW